MFRKLSNLFVKTHNLKQAFGILFVTVLLSNILGLLRDMVMTNRVGIAYGSIAPLDKFYAAFVLPDLLYNILIVGALSSAILPLLVKIDTDEDNTKFWRTYNMLLCTGAVAIVVGLIILFFVMPIFMSRLFPGFNAADIKTTTELTRIMLLSPLFFTISQISTSALQAKRVFLAPALAPIIYNSAIILSAFFVPKYGISMLVIGTIIGAVGHFLIQLPSLRSHGWRFKFLLGFYDEKIRHIVKIMLPRTIALTSTQLLLLVFFRLASSMTHGSITIYQLTDDLQTAPVLLLANSLAVAILPDFARHFAKDEHAEFQILVTKIIRLLLFIFLPVTSFLLIYRTPIMNLFIALGHSISHAQVDLAAYTFGWFVASLFFQGAVLILARAFFARGDTYHPTVYSLFSLAVAWGLAELLSKTTGLGVAGLSLSFSVGSTINAYLLWRSLKFGPGHLIKDELGRNNFWPIIAGTAMSIMVFWMIRQIGMPALAMVIGKESFRYLLVTIIGFAGGLGVFLGWAKFCNLEQWQLIVNRNNND